MHARGSLEKDQLEHAGETISWSSCARPEPAEVSLQLPQVKAVSVSKLLSVLQGRRVQDNALKMLLTWQREGVLKDTRLQVQGNTLKILRRSFSSSILTWQREGVLKDTRLQVQDNALKLLRRSSSSSILTWQCEGVLKDTRLQVVLAGDGHRLHIRAVGQE